MARNSKSQRWRGGCCCPSVIPIMVDIVLETILFIRLVYRYVAGATTSDSGSPLNLRREIRDVDDISALKPVKLGSLTLRNKVVRAAAFGGATFDELIRMHSEVARGGVAMTTIAYTSVSHDGLTFASQPLLVEENFSDLQRLAAAVHDAGAAISIQLTHAGAFADRKVTGTVQKAPSIVFNPAGFDWPKAMDDDDFDRIQGDFRRAAQLVKRAGFDAVELHCGHGYLLSQFICPHTNRRRDRYGGSIQNRLRFPVEVFRSIRNEVGHDFPILVKLNVCDGFPGGISEEDAIEVAVAFAREGADSLVLSGGNVARAGFYMLRGRVPLKDMARAMPHRVKALALKVFGRFYVPTVPFQHGFFRKRSRKIIDQLSRNVPSWSGLVCAIGGLDTIESMEAALDEGFGLIQAARALIRDPDFVRKTASQYQDKPDGSHHNVHKCIHCNMCVVATLNPQGPMSCPERLADGDTLF